MLLEVLKELIKKKGLINMYLIIFKEELVEEKNSKN
jgi:hypothetical protein